MLSDAVSFSVCTCGRRNASVSDPTAKVGEDVTVKAKIVLVEKQSGMVLSQ